MVLKQLEELWSTYAGEGNTPIELWFDGGYPAELKPQLVSLIKRLLPNSCAFNGLGISDNPTRWCGTEDGYALDPSWSTSSGDGQGDPNSPYFNPAEVDFTLQKNDNWFYIKDYPIHTLEELVKVYHNSVGLNANMILDLAVPPNGKVDQAHMKRYKEFGNYINSCYNSTPIVSTKNKGTDIQIEFYNATKVDRVVFGEDQTKGQKIRTFSVSVYYDGEWHTIKSGQSVGHKRIVVFDNELTVNKIKLHYDVSQTVFFEARNCHQHSNEIKFLE